MIIYIILSSQLVCKIRCFVALSIGVKKDDIAAVLITVHWSILLEFRGKVLDSFSVLDYPKMETFCIALADWPCRIMRSEDSFRF